MPDHTPINIALLDAIKTGNFDCLKLGQKKEWIINNFPPPDDVYKDNYTSPIWFYGNIELHFQDDETLFLIYSDNIDELNGGQSLILDKWILSDPEKLTLENVISSLNKERIGFKLAHKTLTNGYSSASIHILLSSVSLSFAPTEKDEEEIEEYLSRCIVEDSNLFKLASFSLTTDELRGV